MLVLLTCLKKHSSIEKKTKCYFIYYSFEQTFSKRIKLDSENYVSANRMVPKNSNLEFLIEFFYMKQNY